MALAPGLLSFVRIVVADTDTATAMGSGDVPVLATPRLLALAEAAAVAAIRPGLESGLTSVSTSAALEHKRPSPVGAQVEVEAELTEVDGRRLAFRFIARQKQPPGSPDGEDAVVGAGTLERALVEGPVRRPSPERLTLPGDNTAQRPPRHYAGDLRSSAPSRRIMPDRYGTDCPAGQREQRPGGSARPAGHHALRNRHGDGRSGCMNIQTCLAPAMRAHAA